MHSSILDEAQESRKTPFVLEVPVAHHRILIVDDDELVRDTLSALLQEQGYLTSTAVTGEEALALTTHEKPSLIVLDLEMPGLGGLSTLKMLRQSQSCSDIPIIVVSGHGLATVRKMVGDVYGCAYLAKPLRSEQIVAAIESHLGCIDSQSLYRLLASLGRQDMDLSRRASQASGFEMRAFRACWGNLNLRILLPDGTPPRRDVVIAQPGAFQRIVVMVRCGIHWCRIRVAGGEQSWAPEVGLLPCADQD